MKKICSFLILVIMSLPLLSCDEKKSRTEEKEYNVLFLYPASDKSAKRVYIGTVKGLSSCKYIAGQYYFKRRFLLKEKWAYICCLRTEKNECAEEHKYDGEESH